MTSARSLALLATLALCGCPGAIDDPAPFVAARMDSGAPAARCPDGVSVVDDIFVPRCATSGCHDSATQVVSLDLQSTGVASRVLGRSSASCNGRSLADPNDPDRSAILLKVRPSPPCGSRMPLNFPPLDDEQIACVRA